MSPGIGGISMSANVNDGRTRRFWDIPSAAVQAGYSSRHFRRIIEEEGIPVMRIGRKFFILGKDLEVWQSTHARMEESKQPA
jgi:hypothetical protein